MFILSQLFIVIYFTWLYSKCFLLPEFDVTVKFVGVVETVETVSDVGVCIFLCLLADNVLFDVIVVANVEIDDMLYGTEDVDIVKLVEPVEDVVDLDNVGDNVVLKPTI